MSRPCGASARILAALEIAQRATAQEIAEEARMPLKQVHDALRWLTEPTKIHPRRVYMAKFIREGGKPVAVYALGQHKHAEPPPPIGKAESNRRYVRSKLERLRAASVFNLAMSGSLLGVGGPQKRRRAQVKLAANDGQQEAA